MTLNITEQVAKVLKPIMAAKRIAVIPHINPDGDALGGMSALVDALRIKGIDARGILIQQLPSYLNELFKKDNLIFYPENFSQFSPQISIVIDSSSLDRIGDDIAYYIRHSKVINIDHHASNLNFGDFNWVDADASSVCEMIYEFIKEIDVRITPDMASNIYLGISTDTGNFTHANTSAKCMNIAAKMIACGANPNNLSMALEMSGYNRYRLLALALQSIEFYNGGSISVMPVTHHMMNKAGAVFNDTYDFIEYPRRIKGVDVAILLYENGDGLVHASLRSKGRVDVSKIALGFGGGGHKVAAGCTFNASIDKAKEDLIRAVSYND